MYYSAWYPPQRPKIESHAQWMRTVEPVSEPVTLDDAKRHLRIVQSQDDATIRRMLQASREAAESFMNRGLMTQTWTLMLNYWADEIWLPYAAPLQSVSTVQYYDTANTLQTLAGSGYDVNINSWPGRITRAYNQSWPALVSDRQGGRVVITYVVGYASATLVPERIKQGMRIYLANLDRNRDGLEQYGATAMDQARACWTDYVVRWVEPTTAYGPSLSSYLWH